MAALNESLLDVEQTITKGEQNPIADAARKVMLFYFGVVATAVEESYALIHKLSEQGAIAEKEGRKLFDEIMEKRKQDVEGLEDEINQQASKARSRLTIPSKADIVALDEQLMLLSKKLDDLKV